MPPKKQPKGPTNKTLEKEKKKVVEDKTFGLKNKNKSKVVQQHIKQVTTQVMDGGTKKGGAARQEEMKHKDKAEKQKTAAQKALLASLFKGVVQMQTNEDGEVDKKRTLCPYFKAGVCEKGKKCKFSHNLELEDQRQMAIDLYSDPRAKIGKMPDTIITCRDFLEAVEKNLYGFNWTCPTAGDNCQYRHMLPQGYVLNRDKPTGAEAEESDEEMTLEEKIEEERANLPSDGLTPVTFETFMKWKADRAQRKQEELEARIAQEEAKGRRDKAQMNFMSGRALFQYNPDLFEDDADAADDTIFDEDNSGDEGGPAQQRASDNEEEKQGAQEESKEAPRDNIEEEKKDEEVKVDAGLFLDEGDVMDEDVDFD